jgi:hypothetical protein
VKGAAEELRRPRGSSSRRLLSGLSVLYDWPWGAARTGAFGEQGGSWRKPANDEAAPVPFPPTWWLSRASDLGSDYFSRNDDLDPAVLLSTLGGFVVGYGIVHA